MARTLSSLRSSATPAVVAVTGALCVLAGLPQAAQAAAYSGLAHPCNYRYGTGSYQDVSYAGATSCAEARGLIANLTRDGKRTPVVGVATGYTPHGTWRCVTVRRVELHGEIESSHRITCALRDDPRGRTPRIRFFFES